MTVNWIGLWTFTSREIARFFRVYMQTLLTPLVSALLYILVFGKIVGSRISTIGGVSYIDFVLPGLVMMNIIQSAFSQTSMSLYFQRFARHIEEILVAPFSYLEMIIAYVIGGVVRALIVGACVYLVAIVFTTATIANLGMFIIIAVAVSIIFSLAGLLVGLWSEHFEHLAIPQTFIIMPLTFLGGIFSSLSMLPPALQIVMKFNPFFYFVDNMRAAMIGVRESDPTVSFIVIVGLILVLGTLVWQLFKRGYKLRS